MPSWARVWQESRDGMTAHTAHARRQPTIDEPSEEALPRAGGLPTLQRRREERRHTDAETVSLHTLMHPRADDVRQGWLAMVSRW
jgi:hypothetical protein